MLSIEHARKILNNPKLTDQEVERIRDEFKRLAEVIFQKWQEDKAKKLLGVKKK